MIKKYQNELEKILTGCSLCKAKLCNLCPNGKRKKYLKEEIKKLSPKKESFLEKIKKFLQL
jgi:hypothetical protein